MHTYADRKVAIVTGSASGIGSATAILLAERGCNVVINYTKSTKEAESTAEQCRRAGAQALIVQGNISDDSTCRKLVAAAVDAWERVDYLVNNAGKTQFIPYEELDKLSRDIFLDIYEVNVVGGFQMIRAASEQLKKNAGAVVNVSSIGGITGIASCIPYAASKAALNMLTRSLALTLAPHIRINAVCPGPVQTRWLKSGMGDSDYDKLITELSQQVALHKVSQPEDIARSIVALLMDHIDVTGEIIKTDAGLHLGVLPGYSSQDKSRGLI